MSVVYRQACFELNGSVEKPLQQKSLRALVWMYDRAAQSPSCISRTGLGMLVHIFEGADH